MRRGLLLMSYRMFLPALFVVLAGPSACVSAPPRSDAAVEYYGGEAWLGSEPAIPVHLEIRRNGRAASGAIRSHGAEFTLEDARGDAIVTATLGEPGQGSIIMRFGPKGVEGEFELGGQAGRFEAAATDLDAAAFFAEPEQNLDITAAEWAEDLDRFVEIIVTRHGSPFHHTPEARFRREVERVRTALPALSGAQAALEFRKLAAMIGDGHTSVSQARGRPYLPIEAYWFEDGIRLVGVAEAHRTVLGARLVAISDLPVTEVVERLRPYVPQGESPWSFRYVAPFLFAELDVLDDAGIGSGSSRSFTFETADGGRQTIMLTAANTRRALLGGSRPFWEQAPNEDFRRVPLPDGSLYVNWRSYERLPEETAALLAAMELERPRRLIIDLRDSGGGDFNIGRDFIRRLADLSWLNRPDRLFVLTGRRSFSAAMTNAADFRKLTRATLVGEPPGAAPNNWQEVRFFHLPHSGLRVGVSTVYYEFLPGEQTVYPDLFIPPTPSDWGGEFDAAVMHILGLPYSE